MQFLTLSRRRTERFSEAEFSARVDAEIEQARVLYSQGFIRQIWHVAMSPGPVSWSKPSPKPRCASG